MHHIHVSTPFMLVATVLVIGVLWAILAYRARIKRDKLYATTPRPSYDAVFANRPTRPVDGAAFEQPAPVYTRGYASPGPTAAAPVYYPHNSGSDLLTGVILGEAMAGGFGGHSHDTTVVHDSGSSYSPSSDSGFSYDSGSSFDSGSSGGFDASW